MMNNEGLNNKYRVYNRRTKRTEESCFVLKPLNDEIARKCIALYAELTPNKELKADLEDWLKHYTEYKCIMNRVCVETGSPVCCCHCSIRDTCECDENSNFCDLVRYEDITSSKECLYNSASELYYPDK